MADAKTVITGTVKNKFPEEKVTEKMTKRVIWLATDDEYSKTYEIEFINDKISLIGSVEVGDKLTVDCYVNGREWSRGDKSGVFISLRGFDIK